MNRRSFLRAATGCAVAMPVAAATISPSTGKFVCFDNGADSISICVLWKYNRLTGGWEVVDEVQFNSGAISW